MIKNDQQLRVAQLKLEALQAEFDGLKDEDQESYRQLIDAASSEMHEYQDIRAGIRTDFFVRSLDELGEALIKARIARRWTQKQLAEKLDVAEQMVQRDERRDYENAGLVRIADVVDVLEYELVGHLRPRKTSTVLPDAQAAIAPESRTTNVHVNVNWSHVSPGVDAGDRAIQ